MLTHLFSVFAGHHHSKDNDKEPPYSTKLVTPTLFGYKDGPATLPSNSRTSCLLYLHPIEFLLLQLILSHLFRSSPLGRILRRTILQWIISRFRISMYLLLFVPTIHLFRTFQSTIDPFVASGPPLPHLVHHQSIAFIPISLSEISLSPPASLYHPSPATFAFPLRLCSDSTQTLPKAMHSHLSRADFDPDFVATLLSRSNTSDDLVDIILDTGCTFSITPDRRDFVDYIPSGALGQVQTVNGPTQVAGYGQVRWTLIREDGTKIDLLIPCHHVPSSSVRLLSPQDFCHHHGFDCSTDHFGGNSNYFWMHADHNQSRFQCPIDPRSNLPVALAKIPCNQGGCDSEFPTDVPSSCPSCHRHGIVSLSVLEETNQNITAAQKDLLLWHFRLGHMGFQRLQQLMRSRTVEALDHHIIKSEKKSSKSITVDPCIVPKNPSTRTCKPPLCAACQIARAKRRPTDVSTTTIHQEALLKVKDLEPGARVSVDQYESAVRGRLATSRGKESFGHKYAGGTIFCDHASGFIQCHHQVSLRATDTVISKRAFERAAKSCGVQVKSYHGDNGIFKSKEFEEALTKLEQQLKFSGVGAHHQNGIAERNIRTVTEKARTMMQHTYIHWPDEFEIQLWPLALDYACWLHNHTPSHTHGWAPIEIFCGTRVDCQHLQRARVWGCPGYVLSPTLQDGKKIPKWAPRARRGQFLGFSTNHSSMIGLLRNIQTGSITPQFHVVYDEHFSTVHSFEEDDPTWIELFVSEREYYGPDEEEEESDTIAFPDIDPSWVPITETKDDPQSHQQAIQPELADKISDPVFPDPDVRADEAIKDETPEPSDVEPTTTPRRTVTFRDDVFEPTKTTEDRPLRHRKQNKRVFGDEWVNHTVQLTPTSRTMLGHIVPTLNHDDLFLHSLDWDAPFIESYASYHMLNLLHVDPYTDEVEWFHPFTLGAKASSEDTPTLRDIQRLSPAEIDLWYDAMDIELEALRNKDTFTEIHRTSVPNGCQIIKSTWAFRRKRRPNGEIHKLKARFVVRGDLQVLNETESTYSPVVDWSTVRLLFILTVAQQLKSTTIDFNAAFVQSNLPKPIYLELPPGYSVPGEDRVYKVIKSLYGDVRAAKLWYKHLSEALVSQMGLTKSSIDSCLYFRDGLVFVFYVDDGIIISHDDAQTQRFIEELRACRFELGVEEDYAGYLGVDVVAQPDGSLLLAQTGLIKRILVDFGLTDSASTKVTPVAEILGAHKASAPFEDSYNYRSVIGKIMYLSSNTRLEISLANHQCARFSNDPRTPHGVALKRIGRYLLGTRDKGMIVKPSKDLTLDCYADADFAGLFSSSDPDDPKSVKSRSGFVITLAKIPVAWGGGLQSETALSTMEAEYISLSKALRILLPLRIILDEIAIALGLKHDPHSTIKSTVFEDNQACLSLATSDPPKMTPRSKSIAVKYHWFREHLEPGVIDIKPIASAEQLADIFTKPLAPGPFLHLRKQLLGW